MKLASGAGRKPGHSRRFLFLSGVVFICSLFISTGLGLSAEKGIADKRSLTLTSIIITGKPVFSSERVVRAMGVEKGERVSSAELKGVREKIRRFYQGQGYLQVEVGQPQLVPVKKGEALLTVEINAGYRIRVEFPGEGFTEAGKLRELTGLMHRSIFSETVLKEAERRIQAYYREKGYYFVDVRYSVATDETKGLRAIRFHVERGKQVWVDKIRVKGNRAFNDRRIERVMRTKETGVFHGGLFRDEVLKEDPERIEGFYFDRGYLEAEVASPGFTFHDGKERVSVDVEVEEGARHYYGGTALKGFGALRGPEAERLLGLKRGGPLGVGRAEKGIDVIRKYYLDHGFLDVELSSELVRKESGVVDLGLEVKEGTQYKVGGISIAGNRKTRESIVLRKLTLEPGTIYSQEKVQKSVQNLRESDLFSTIKVQPKRREGAEGIMDVALEVEEKKPGLVEIGVGYGNEEGISGHLRGEYRNLWGKGRKIEGMVKGSNLGSESELGYEEPYLFGRDVAGSAKARYIEQDEKFFKVRKLENIYSVKKVLREVYALELSYSLEFTDIFDIQPLAVLEEAGGIKRVAFLSPSLTRDTRDNLLNPHKGMFTRLGAEFAPELVGSEVEYYRLMARHVSYFTLADDVVVEINTQAGRVGVFGRTTTLPLDKRFFLGGTESVRGFSRNSIGPVDALGGVVGGDASLSYSMEVRIPLIKDFYAAVFTDGGDSWLEDPPAGVRNRPFRFSAGPGLRYSTPVGFLRLDLGFKLNRLRGEGANQVHFFVGRAF